MVSIGVYVTSRYKNYEEFKATMDEAVKKYIPVGKPNALCTGSSKSNNAGNGLVKRYAFENGIPCRVFETQWANNIPTKPGKKNTAGVRANAMIIRNSNYCIMFWAPTAISKWDFMSGGCYNFQKMCGKMRRELIPIKVDIYKPIELKPSGDEIGDIDSENEMMIGVGGTGISSDLGGMEEPSVGSAPIHSFGGGGSAPQPPIATGGVGDMPQDGVGDDISVPSGGSPLSPSAINIPKSGSGISEIPVDITGDGVPDTSITTMDTTGDGMPDSQLTPVDIDNNGTVDKVELSPLPQLPQNAKEQQPIQQNEQPTQQIVPQNQPIQQNVNVTADNENEQQ